MSQPDMPAPGPVRDGRLLDMPEQDRVERALRALVEAVLPAAGRRAARPSATERRPARNGRDKSRS